MNLNNTSGVPLYIQLSNRLQELIQDGTYKKGEKIPSEDELGTMYSVSRVTVRKALDVLVQDGVLRRSHGLGTFVANSIFIESPYAQGSFTASCKQQGVTPSTKILHMEKVEAKDKIAADMGIKKGAHVYELRRLRLANGLASIYEIDYISCEMGDKLLSENLEDASLLAVIEKKCGMRYDGVQDMFDIAYATGETAKSLDCKEDTPLLCVYQKVYSTDKKVMYVNNQYIRSDRYKYVCNSVKGVR
ncbi:MAG: GntR family transcriptional regulator [Eubacteriales bacterium]|nr:GntR family transcriptional regulator [Eubacteriales bacterium]